MASHADSLRITIGGVEVAQLAAVGTLAGVVVRAAAAANGPGVGLLEISAGKLAWQPPGADGFGPAVAVPTDGEYLVSGSDAAKWLRVEVYTTHLPATNHSARVELADRYNGIAGDDVTAAEAAAGSVETFTLTLTNQSAGMASDVRAWLKSASGLELSAGGSTWSAPTSEAAAIGLGDVAPAASLTLYVRRTIAPGASPSPAVLSCLAISFLTS